VTLKAVILCGGSGTRIRDVADDIPKPMIRIGERPVLWHVMKSYAHFGIKDFVLCLGYKGWIIKEFFLNYRTLTTDITVDLSRDNSITLHNSPSEDWSVTLADTGECVQTGAHVRRVRGYLANSELFCLTYGDGVADIDIAHLVQFHRSHGRIGTVTGVRPPGRFGVMKTIEGETLPIVRQFEEKPQSTEALINGGFFVFDQRLWKYLNDDPDLIFEHEPLANLARDGELVLYEHDGFWQPMDTYREWKLLNERSACAAATSSLCAIRMTSGTRTNSIV
jgi:glucose-1-phosphate cytidylyltransferase